MRLHLFFFREVDIHTEVGPIITAVTPTALRGGARVGGAGQHRPAPGGRERQPVRQRFWPASEALGLPVPSSS